MNAFVVLCVGFVIAITLEKLFPRTKFPQKENWYFRSIAFNMVQFGVVVVAGYTWEVWLDGPSLFKLPWCPLWNGIFAYVVTAYIFYNWHLLRHVNNFWWLTTHQIHHSPVIITAITSFYKHPLEIIINSLIITVVTCPILGLDQETNQWLTVLTGLAEFFYHLNCSTPYWLGYFIQRPEMHLLHHFKNKQFTWNYGDLPIFDILNGTWWNPTDYELEVLAGREEDGVITGFTNNREMKLVDMLLCQNVLIERPKKLPLNLLKCGLMSFLLFVGCLNTVGLVFRSPSVRGVGIVSAASPLPFVFSSFEGVETFSTMYYLDIAFKNGTRQGLVMDHKLYGRLNGPYNYKNQLGAVFSHGPFFKDPQMIMMRDQILNWCFCRGHLSKDFGIGDDIDKVVITIKSKTIGNEDKKWVLNVVC
jgi:sterol desaturase/sphingolipid hydroxylase (fatty acid hydroxylase superfamily)